MSLQAKVQKIYLDENLKKSLLDKIPLLAQKRILVIGDVGLDEYVSGAVKRISPEAPVPVVDVDSEEKRLGLSANVAQNIVSLGGKVSVLSVVGADMGAHLLAELFNANHIPWTDMIVDAQRPTTRKLRVMAGPHHIVRIDYELKKYISKEVSSTLLKNFTKLIKSYDGVILQDYAKGVLSEELIQNLIEVTHQHKKPVFVDPHRSNALPFYRNADLFKPNYDEAIELAGMTFDDLREHPDKVYLIGETLQKKLGTENVVITRGKEGMTIFSGHQIVEVPTYARKVFDVTGAGDTVIATLALSQVAGFSLVESCVLANIAAGNVVAKIGCVPCDLEEMKTAIKEYEY